MSEFLDGASSNAAREEKDPPPLPANTALWVELQTLSSRITAVNEIAMAINRTLDLDEILQLVGQRAKWLLDFDHCSVFLTPANGLHRLITLFHADHLHSKDGTTLDMEVVDVAMRTKQSQLYFARASANHPLYFRSQLVIPMESEGEVLGTLQFANWQAQEYTQEDLRIGSMLALQLTGAIRNAMRFEEVNKLYRELESTYATLRQAEQMRDDLVHMIVHDLHNPLTVINFSLSMLERMVNAPPRPEAAMKSIRRAQKSAKQMMGMIDELLDVSRLDAGELQLRFTLVDFIKLVNEKSEDYRLQAPTAAKTFITKTPVTLPPLVADAALLGRVIDNLLSNAFKHTPAGGQIELNVECQAEVVCLSVRDTGPGIPLAYQDRIFDKFVQATKPAQGALRIGTGLGLAFCRLAVEAHGGKIWVESVPEQGSTFIFTLPFEQSLLT